MGYFVQLDRPAYWDRIVRHYFWQDCANIDGDYKLLGDAVALNGYQYNEVRDSEPFWIGPFPQQDDWRNNGVYFRISADAERHRVLVKVMGSNDKALVSATFQYTCKWGQGHFLYAVLDDDRDDVVYVGGAGSLIVRRASWDCIVFMAPLCNRIKSWNRWVRYTAPATTPHT